MQRSKDKFMEVFSIVLLFIILILCALAVAELFLLLKKKNIGAPVDSKDIERGIDKAGANVITTLAALINASDNATANVLSLSGDGVNKSVDKMIEYEKSKAETAEKRMQDFTYGMDRKLQDVLTGLESNMSKVREELTSSLEKVRADNTVQMEQMRSVVDEKLSQTLETRLKTTFGQVREQLESLFGKLGEMQSLAQGVTNLNKLLGGIKTRGTWGEVSLNNLLEEIMTEGQFGRNVKVKKGSDEMVDFAIIMPGKNEQNIYLPIDCKFPMEDYARLLDAGERDDKEAFLSAQKQLERAVKDSAKSIKSKYIYPPETTDFAIMYLPNEALYAEVVRSGTLIEELQRSYRIVVSGPSTISATLNSLQMGFKTLAIEKRSVEIRKTLIEFRRDFDKFSKVLDLTKQKLESVVNTIDEAQDRTTLINKRLGKIEVLDEPSDTLVDEDKQ